LTFNPFGKPVKDLSEADLQKLLEGHIAEGLYVEYKTVFPLATKVAHSIASFANTHGGWYIVGIRTNENNEPASIDGFDLSSNVHPKEWLRDVVKSNVDPMPYIESKLITFSSGRVVLVTHVPKGYETPYVTRDGRIYRRNAEGSDPVFENNRYAIDQLYENGKQFKEILTRFCQSEFTYSRAEKEQGWLIAYLLPYPLDSFPLLDFTKERIEGLRALISSPVTIRGIADMGVPFQVMQSSLDSVTFRQVRPNQLPYLTTTLRIFRGGAAKFLIPLPYLDPVSQVEEYASSSAFAELLTRIPLNDASLFKVVDGYNLFTSFMALTAKFIEFLHKSDWAESNLLVAYELQKTWRHILFFNSDAFAEQIRSYGVPVCHEDGSLIPRTLERESMTISLQEADDSLAADFGLVSDYFGVFRDTWIKSVQRGWAEYLSRIQEVQRQTQDRPGPSQNTMPAS